MRQHYAENADKCRAAAREYQKTHREQRNAYVRRKYAENKEKESLRSRAKYLRNKDKIKARHRRNYENKKAEALQRYWRYKALKAGSTVNLASIKQFVKSVKASDTFVCYYCSEIHSTKTLHFDHIIPLSRGGPHSVENLCASCPSCNMSKNDNFIHEWVKMGQQMLSL